jgi:hypothetical protein
VNTIKAGILCKEVGLIILPFLIADDLLVSLRYNARKLILAGWAVISTGASMFLCTLF